MATPPAKLYQPSTATGIAGKQRTITEQAKVFCRARRVADCLWRSAKE